MISTVSEERPCGRFFEIYDKCLLNESTIGIVNQELISIDNDKT